MSENAKKAPLLRRAFDHLAGTEAGSAYLDKVANARARDIGLFQKYGKDLSNVDPAELKAFAPDASIVDDVRQRLTEHPLKGRIDLAEGMDGTMSPLTTSGGLLWENIKANKGKAIGTGLLGAGNIAGLVDNDKILGQAVGSGLGTLAGLAIKPVAGWGPLGVVNSALVGGNLGALFDNLRAKKEQEDQYQQQYV